MSERPADVRIEDLTDPVFPPEIAEAMEAFEPLAEAVVFDVQTLLDQACAETGLDDFGDDLHVAPLAVIMEVADTEASLGVLGRLSVWNNLLGNAKTKLLVADLLKRHPEIHEIPVSRPIVIAGQARTGTTHLHNLMSCDPNLRTLPYWEACEPVPPLAEQGQAFDVDPRWTRCEQSLAGLNTALPLFKRMHDMYPDHIHEEISLLAIACGGMAMETMVNSTTWRDWYLASDQTPYYEYMKTMLKVLSFQSGRTASGDLKRWLLKSPQHVEQLPTLMKVFPDATVICTHRDPVSVTASGMTMLAYTARMSVQSDQLTRVGRYWGDRFERMFRSYVADRDVVPASQSIDVLFHEFMADDIGTVRRIYDVAGLEFTDELVAATEAFMEEHPRGKYGRVLYDTNQFGVDRAERRQALQFYVDRFGVQIEGS